MDGIYAVLLLFTGLIDMWINHCDRGCLKPPATVARHMVSTGQMFYEAESVGRQVFYRYDLPVSYGPFRTSLGASIDSRGDIWFGAGISNIFYVADGRGFAEFSFMPGIWLQGDGPPLGHPVEFLSGLEIGIEQPDGMRYSMTADHKSNGGLGYPARNLGMETIQIRMSGPSDVILPNALPSIGPR